MKRLSAYMVMFIFFLTSLSFGGAIVSKNKIANTKLSGESINIRSNIDTTYDGVSFNDCAIDIKLPIVGRQFYNCLFIKCKFNISSDLAVDLSAYSSFDSCVFDYNVPKHKGGDM